MKSSTVRIDEESRALLHDLAIREGRPMRVVLQHALESYRRRMFLKQCGDAYAQLKANDKAWKKELEEREEWDVTIADGIEKG